MKQNLITFAIVFLACLLAIAIAAAIVYFGIFLPWWTAPLAPPLDIHTLVGALGTDYLWLWGVEIAGVFLEGAAIAIGIWQLVQLERERPIAQLVRTIKPPS